MATKLDLSNKIFGRLTVIKENGRNKYGSVLWLCLCNCGKTKDVTASSLNTGNNQSCGCLLIENRTKNTVTHGQGRKGKCTSEFTIWCGIKNRCSGANGVNRHNENYFGRGIKVCDSWINSFENFFSDMGKRPSNKHSLDRIDNDGNYEPKNCRWATRKEQNRNQRSNKKFTYNGVTMYLADWCVYFGVCDSTLSVMVKRWDFDTLYSFYLKKNGTLPATKRIGKGGASLIKTLK